MTALQNLAKTSVLVGWLHQILNFPPSQEKTCNPCLLFKKGSLSPFYFSQIAVCLSPNWSKWTDCMNWALSKTLRYVSGICVCVCVCVCVCTGVCAYACVCVCVCVLSSMFDPQGCDNNKQFCARPRTVNLYWARETLWIFITSLYLFTLSVFYQ